MPNRYLFVLRGFNDIDHITPVIYFLLREKKNIVVDIHISSINYNFTDNMNLKYLADTYKKRLNFYWIGDKANIVKRFLWGKGIISRIYKKIFIKRLNSRIQNKVFIQKYFKENYGKHCSSIKIVAFDMNVSATTSYAIEYFKKINVKCIGLPHGVDVYGNMMLDTIDSSKEYKDVLGIGAYKIYDRLVITDKLLLEKWKKYYNEAGEAFDMKDNIEVLGSIRFSPEWLEIRKNFIKPYVHETEKIKIVFFMSKTRGNIFQDEVLRTIEFIEKFSNISLVLKPHTRGMYFSWDKKENVIVEPEISSSSLIEWADVVMFVGTSIVIEALYKDKTVIYMDYLHTNSTVFDGYNACWVLRTRDDLRRALHRLSGEPGYRPYKKTSTENMLRRLVQADIDMPVYRRYIDFLDNIQKQ